MSLKAIDLVPAFVWMADTPLHIVHAWIDTGKPHRAAEYARKKLCIGLEEASRMTGLGKSRILDLMDEGRLPKPLVNASPSPRWFKHGFYNAARLLLRDLRLKGEL